MMRNLNSSTGVLVSDAPTGEPAVSEMDDLRAELSAVLGVALTTEDDDAHLFELGLQSVQLMRALTACVDAASVPVSPSSPKNRRCPPGRR